MSSKEPTGYLSPAYAASLREFGTPMELPQAKGWILKRRVGDSRYNDAMGIYPRLMCQDWAFLAEDVTSLSDTMVSLAFVTDVFAPVSLLELSKTYDIAFEYKMHYIVDFDSFQENAVSKSARYRARRALKSVRVDICDNPLDYQEEWLRLYGQLVIRHSITGIQRFSSAAFKQQLSVPGLIMFRATHAGETIGIYLLYLVGDAAYYHLAAYDEVGYATFASYALQWTVLEYLKTRVRWLDLGGGAGVNEDPSDGLSRFKKAWANCEKKTIFCGKVFDYRSYERICRETGTENESFFPAYRSGSSKSIASLNTINPQLV